MREKVHPTPAVDARPFPCPPCPRNGMFNDQRTRAHTPAHTRAHTAPGYNGASAPTPISPARAHTRAGELITARSPGACSRYVALILSLSLSIRVYSLYSIGLQERGKNAVALFSRKRGRAAFHLTLARPLSRGVKPPRARAQLMRIRCSRGGLLERGHWVCIGCWFFLFALEVRGGVWLFGRIPVDARVMVERAGVRSRGIVIVGYLCWVRTVLRSRVGDIYSGGDFDLEGHCVKNAYRIVENGATHLTLFDWSSEDVRI